MAVSLKNVDGLDKLAIALRGLPDALSKKYLKKAVTSAAAVVRDTARELAPVWDQELSGGQAPAGTLRKSIILKAIPEKSDKDKQTVFVLVRHGKKYQKVFKRKKGIIQPSVNQDAWYWRFPEFGTVRQVAKPYMRPAFELRKDDAVETIRASLEKAIEEEVKK